MTTPIPLALETPPAWLPGGHLQTLLPAWWGRRLPSAVQWQRERWTTPDEDFVDVDWMGLDESAPSGAPLVVLFHGLEGSSESHYAKALSRLLKHQGWGMAVVHFRGCSGELNRGPRAYHSGDVAEVQWMLERVRRIHAQRPVVAVGVSLGGNALMRWAGSLGPEAARWLDAAVAVSAPLDLTACGEALGRGFNRHVYTRLFLQTMVPKAQAKWQQYPGLFDLDGLRRCRTLYDFDDVFTAPVHGYGNARRYWHEASAKPVLKDIRIPTLIINATNDPFVPASCLPRSSEVSSHVTLWQPAHGGHVGFPLGGTARAGDALTGALPQVMMDWVRQALEIRCGVDPRSD